MPSFAGGIEGLASAMAQIGQDLRQQLLTVQAQVTQLHDRQARLETQSLSYDERMQLTRTQEERLKLELGERLTKMELEQLKMHEAPKEPPPEVNKFDFMVRGSDE